MEKQAAPGTVFESFLEKLNPGDCHFLFVFHLSKNNEFYLERWVRKVNTLGVISIPYSEQPSVRKTIGALVPVYSPSLGDIPDAIERICNDHREKRIVLVEIGGYSAPLLDRLPNVVLVVEDTMRGHRNFEAHAERIACPVISIACTGIKAVENRKIGEAVVDATLRLCRSLSKTDFTTLLMSFGGVGKHAAETIRTLNLPLLVYDADENKREAAREEGYIVPEREEAFSRADIIIGCTGNRCLETSDIKYLKEGCLLVSGSSRQIEFPYEELVPYITSVHADVAVEKFEYDGKTFHIAFKGQPINFYYDIPLGEIFEIPMVGLVQAVIYGLSGKAGNGIHHLPVEQQAIVAEAFPKVPVELGY